MNRRSQGYEPCEIPLLHPALNPDSRVSKVFNVSCLPRVVSDIYFFFKKKSMNNKNLNQGGAPSCVPDDKYARQDSNLFNFPLKRAHQLQKLKKGGLKRKCQKQPFYLCFLLHNYIITDFFQLPLYHFCVFRAYHGAFLHIS